MSVIGEYEMVEGTQFELEAYTPGGGDMLHTIELGEGEEGDLFAWRDAFQEMYDNFDPWREAHLWLDEEGNPSPESPFWHGLECYEDIKRYDEETLEATLDDLKRLALSA
jgi:hypothetical protein